MNTMNVEDFSKAVGVSKNAVYKAIKPGGKLEKYVVIVGGKRHIRAGAMSLYTNSTDFNQEVEDIQPNSTDIKPQSTQEVENVNQNSTDFNQEVEDIQPNSTTENAEIISFLRAENERLNAENAELRQRIAEYTERAFRLAENAQEIASHAQVLHLAETTSSKKGFFKKLFLKKGDTK